MINKIICGDCLEVMKDILNNFIDLTITSPPYDNLRDYKGYNFNFKGIAKELYRVTKQGGIVVWVIGEATINGSETGTSFRQALYFKEIGFNLHDTMIYHRYARFPDNQRYFQEFEYMFILSKDKPKSVNFISDVLRSKRHSLKEVGTKRQKDGSLKKWTAILSNNETRRRGNIWSYGVATNETYHLHPASFPESLIKDHIISWSNKGDIVLDPMCGSGTTCKMAKKLGRKYIGIDISKKYCEMARNRIKVIPGLLPFKEKI